MKGGYAPCLKPQNIVTRQCMTEGRAFYLHILCISPHCPWSEVAIPGSGIFSDTFFLHPTYTNANNSNYKYNKYNNISKVRIAFLPSILIPSLSVLLNKTREQDRPCCVSLFASAFKPWSRLKSALLKCQQSLWQCCSSYYSSAAGPGRLDEIIASSHKHLLLALIS